MQMPGMDGAALGGAIKAEARLAATKLVMLTSLAARGDAAKLQALGFAGYVTKPMRHLELKAVMSLALAAGTGAEPAPIATRHTAREIYSRFAGRKARILLAEDNITNQQVALGILKKLGLRADAVANGAEALKALETLPYDLVLMDVQMPELDGLEATRIIRARSFAGINHLIPVIAMTAHAMQGDRERCLESGMNDYIAKPVSPQKLAETLAKWLPGEAAAAAELVPEREPAPAALKAAAFVFPEASELPVFDKAGVLDRLMGDEAIAREVAGVFLTDIPGRIAALSGCLAAGDAKGAEHQAHAIKGASANVGGERLSAAAFTMEREAKAGNLAAGQTRLAALEAQFAALQQAIKKEW
jgi:CheY-like chemotaxis protein/HPt (histidine-containing phosphotransfer) domain-containing protein